MMATRSPAAARAGGRHRDVVDEAEAHTDVAGGVVARGSSEDHGGVAVIGTQRINRRQTGARRHPGRLPRARADRGVGIQGPAPCRAQVGERLEVAGVVHQGQLGRRGRQSGRQAHDGIAIRDVVQRGDGRHQAGRALGMAGARVMVIGRGRGDQQAHVCSVLLAMLMSLPAWTS